MRSPLSRWLAVPALAAGLAALPACDFAEPSLDDFEVILQVDDVPVDLGAGVTAAVRPDRPTAASTTVSTDFDVEAVNDLESIRLEPSMFTFTASGITRAAYGSGAPSGTITGYVFIAGVPVPGTPVTVTITDGAVTAVSPEIIASATSSIDEAVIERFLSALPEDERPDLSDWQSLTVDQVRDRIREALDDTSIPVSFGLEVESTDPLDPLVGSITLNEIDISAVVTR